MLRSGKVWIKDAPTSYGGRSICEQDITIKSITPKMTVGRDPAIVYKTDQLAVVWKPPGLLSVPARSRAREHSLLSFVRIKLGVGEAVHRLDETCSGLMLVALTTKSQELLKKAIETRAIERRYLALCNGHCPQSLEIESHLVRNRGDGLRGSWEHWHKNKPTAPSTPPEDSLYSKTYVHRRSLHDGFSLVEVKLDTGRTHQIRIHLSESGYPLLGDPLYAPHGIKRKAPRTALHAYKLVFKDPFSSKNLSFEAPIADDLAMFMASINKPTEPLKDNKRKKRRKKR